MKTVAITGLIRAFASTGVLIPALAFGGPELEVRDLKGRAISIELIGADQKSVSFRRKDNPKEFTLGLDQFDAESQAAIRKEAAELPPVLPKIEADVVIGKRRDKGDSYYMVRQEISCSVKLRNPSQELSLPNLTARVIFFGRNQKTPEAYTVLSNQEFPVGLKPGETSSNALQPFVTNYDSDNKGVGNIGGYQYSGYLLVFLNEKQEVVFDQTTDGSIRQAITGRPKLLNAVAAYKKDAYVDEKLLLQDAALRPPNYLR